VHCNLARWGCERSVPVYRGIDLRHHGRSPTASPPFLPRLILARTTVASWWHGRLARAFASSMLFPELSDSVKV
jgi:hypothetical protein